MSLLYLTILTKRDKDKDNDDDDYDNCSCLITTKDVGARLVK